MAAKENVIDLTLLSHGIEVQFLNTIERVLIELPESLTTNSRVVDEEGALETAAIRDVVFEDLSHFAEIGVGVIADCFTGDRGLGCVP